MVIKPAFLNVLPSEQHDRFIRNATEIVCESFIFTGDRDYITARFAFFQKQSHLFMWSAAQALEKYLKANILLLGGGSIDKIHDHINLSNILRKTHPELLMIETSIPRGWDDVIWPELDADGFLKRIESIGSPEVRYDQVKLDICLQDLVFLDRLAFKLRYQLVGETVESCKLVGDAMKVDFFRLNYPFAPSDFQHKPLPGVLLFHGSVSKLEAAVNGCFGYPAVYQKWAESSMKLSQKAIAKLLK